MNHELFGQILNLINREGVLSPSTFHLKDGSTRVGVVIGVRNVRGKAEVEIIDESKEIPECSVMISLDEIMSVT